MRLGKFLDGLDLNDDAVGDHEIQSVPTNGLALVLDRDFPFDPYGDAAQPQFDC